MEDTIHGISKWVMGLDPVLAVALISALPWIELRGGIPVGIAVLGMPVWEAFAAAVVSNAAIVTPVVWGAKRFEHRLAQARWSRRIMGWSLARARKHERLVNRYGAIGLALLVAIPLPGTGAWTATAVSILVGMRMRPTLVSIYAGLVIAAAVVTAATTGIIWGADLFTPGR